MTFKELDKYLLSKKGATYDYPFDENVRVYRIAKKMFAVIFEKQPLRLNVKCDPIYALELRSIYEGVSGGYYMNKKHWNTIILEETDVDDESMKEFVDHSYALVYKSLTKKKREALG